MTSSLFMQLAAQAPTLLVEAAAVALAVVFWRRWPIPCLLTLLGSGLMLAISIGRTALFLAAVRLQADLGWTHQQLGVFYGVVGFVSSLGYALGLGLVITAVFWGRRDRGKYLD